MKTLTRLEEQILLAIYRMDEEAYLVNIRTKLQEMTGRNLDVGTINKPLKRLNLQGILDVTYGEPSPVRGGKRIKYYRLTIKAYQSLEETRALHERMWQNIASPLKRV